MGNHRCAATAELLRRDPAFDTEAIGMALRDMRREEVVTLVPALMVIFVRGKIVAEHRNPVNRFLIWIYRPVIAGVLKVKLAIA